MMNGCEVRPARWSDIIDLYDDGEYSAIWGRYDNNARRVLGVRWNGYGESKGFPLSSGHPVWYIEPDFIARGILEEFLNQTISVAGSGGIKDNILCAMSELGMHREINGIHLAIALYAASNRGKTITLKKLVEYLKADKAVVLEERPVYEGSLDLLFCCKYKNRTVGIATGGDAADMISLAFEFFNKYNCDIVFCATRSRSDSNSWQTFLKNTEAKSIRFMSVRKVEVAEPEQEVANSSQARDLMSLVETNGIV